MNYHYYNFPDRLNKKLLLFKDIGSAYPLFLEF